MLDEDLLQVEDRVRLLVNALANERDPPPVLKLYPEAICSSSNQIRPPRF